MKITKWSEGAKLNRAVSSIQVKCLPKDVFFFQKQTIYKNKRFNIFVYSKFQSRWMWIFNTNSMWNKMLATVQILLNIVTHTSSYLQMCCEFISLNSFSLFFCRRRSCINQILHRVKAIRLNLQWNIKANLLFLVSFYFINQTLNGVCFSLYHFSLWLWWKFHIILYFIAAYNLNS